MLGTQISNKETQRKPIDQIRLLLFLDVPPLVRKEQNKETTILQNSMAAIANIKDKLLVEQYQIPTMIYEEAQGNALIRTLQYY